jgi:hypothetical protein
MHARLRRLGLTLAVSLSLGAWGVSAADAGACTMIDHEHAAWSTILRAHVHAGVVDYGRLAAEGAPALDAYLATLSGTCAADYDGWTRSQQLAFWLNAYNAFTVRLVLDEWPLASIRDVGWLPNAAFRRRFIPMPALRGGTISLDAIEHDVVRPGFHEPRVHFALVCAAKSCPVLRREAYRAADLDAQLDDQGTSFLRDPARNRFDVASATLELSAIFDWYRQDFEAGGRSLADFVVPFLDGPTAAAVRSSPRVSIVFLPYDWSLNGR